MFTERKKIVIGETYLFDVLNETNMAVTSSLVTVIKKSKHNKYIVLSVNNGDIFETDAEYLTPYVDPEKASVIRCQYGTTEFTNHDLIYFETVDMMLDMLNTLNQEVKDDFKASEEFSDIIKMSKELTADMREKVTKYVNISNYKSAFKVLGNAYSKIKNNFKCNEEKAVDLLSYINKDYSKFDEMFNSNVDDYISGDINIEDFIDKAEDIIEEAYPKELLENVKDIIDPRRSKISKEEIRETLCKVVRHAYVNDCIAIIIGLDDSENWHIKSVYFDDEDYGKADAINEVMDDFKDYVYDMYPELEQNDYCDPKYRFNVITISKKDNIENDDDME